MNSITCLERRYLQLYFTICIETVVGFILTENIWILSLIGHAVRIYLRIILVIILYMVGFFLYTGCLIHQTIS